MQRSRSLKRAQSTDRGRSSSAGLHHKHTASSIASSIAQEQPLIQSAISHNYGSQASRNILTRSTSASTVHQHDGVMQRNKNIPMVSQLKKWNNDLKKTEEFSRQSSYNSVHSNNSTIMHQKRSFKHSDPSSTTMSSIVAHNSMHSLVPMTVFEEKMAAYQSELDDSDDENYMWIPPVDNRNNHSSASTETPTTTPVPDELLIRDALEEIQNFQDNFVQKYNNANNLTSSRVQQKVLDYKELQEYQPETLVNSLDYNMKIQNETLTSQYTLLRLRFNSVNKMGVMGFISGERKWESNVTSSNLVTKENKDSYIQELWNNEMQVFRTPSPILKSTSQVLASSMDDRSIKSRLRLSIEVNANTNDKDDLLNSHGSLSDMAKNIRLNDV